MLLLRLRRDTHTPTCTLGKLYAVGELREYLLCDTLEDPKQEIKIEGNTAIPDGRYQVVITWSPKFQKFLPLLLKVPGFEGIRIHTGNTADDTRGCILLGTQRDKDCRVLHSHEAFTIVENMLKQELNVGGECWILISDAILAS